MVSFTQSTRAERTPGTVAVSGVNGCRGQAVVSAPTPNRDMRLIKTLTYYLDGKDPRLVLKDWRIWGQPVVNLGAGHLVGDLRRWLSTVTLESLALGEWRAVVALGDWHRQYTNNMYHRKQKAPGTPSNKSIIGAGLNKDGSYFTIYAPVGAGSTGDYQQQRQERQNIEHLRAIAREGESC